MDKIEVLRNTRLGKYFNALEFCNTKDNYAIEVPDITLFQKLDALREIVGSIYISSGYRTKKFNALIGGSSNSYHTKGLATDIKFDFYKWSVSTLRDICVAIGFSNIGIYLNRNGTIAWIHVDIGKRWNAVNGWVHYGNSAVKIYNL